MRYADSASFPLRDWQDAGRAGQRVAVAHRLQVEGCGARWVNFHVMQRTHATLMNEIHDDLSWLQTNSGTRWT
jgi:hypothetical protein